jgi:hypothetical protein
MASRQKNSKSLVEFKALLEADNALSAAASRLRVVAMVKSAGKIEKLRQDLAKQMSAIQDSAYAQARISSEKVSKQSSASKH